MTILSDAQIVLPARWPSIMPRRNSVPRWLRATNDPPRRVHALPAAAAMLASVAALLVLRPWLRRVWKNMWPQLRMNAFETVQRQLLIFVCSPASKSARQNNLTLAAADSEAASISRHMPASYYRGGTADDLRLALLSLTTRRFGQRGTGHRIEPPEPCQANESLRGAVPTAHMPARNFPCRPLRRAPRPSPTIPPRSS